MREIIQKGTVPNDHTGDEMFDALNAVDRNFDELYAGAGVLKFPKAASRFFGFNQGAEVAGAAQTNGTMILTPIYIPKAITITGLVATLTTLSAAGNFQLGLFPVDPATGAPYSTPWCYSASMSTGSLGSPAAAAFAGGSLVSGGAAPLVNTYAWLALQCDNSVAAFAAISPAEQRVATWFGSANAAQVCSGAMIQGVSTPKTFGTWDDITAGTFTAVTTALAPIGGAFASVVP